MKFLSLILLFLFSFTCFAQKSPSSVSVVTGSYTVPAKKYASASVNLEGSATFTVNGTLAMRGTQNSVLSTSPLQYGVYNGFYSLYDVTGNTSTTAQGAAFVSAVSQQVVVQEVYLPSGAIINGTGTWRAIIELYER